MYQKDMEITCLEFQVEAYKCKLLSVGCSADVSSHDGHVRRNNSLPPIRMMAAAKGSFHLKRGASEKDFNRDNNNRSPSPMFNGHYLESEKSCGDNAVVGNMDSYWEQIRKLDERVKERLDCNNKDQEKGSSNHRSLNCRSRSSSVSSKVNYENEPIVVITEVQDIFEVPQTDHQEERKSCGKRKVEQQQGEWFAEGEEKRHVKPEPLPVLQDTLNPKDKTSFVRHATTLTTHTVQPEIFKPSEGQVVKCHMDDGVYKAEIQQLTSRMERLESRAVLRQEISEQRDNDLMLKEMREQLNLLQSEMRSWTSKKKSPSPSQPSDDDSSLIPVKEAMLYFWL